MKSILLIKKFWGHTPHPHLTSVSLASGGYLPRRDVWASKIPHGVTTSTRPPKNFQPIRNRFFNKESLFIILIGMEKTHYKFLIIIITIGRANLIGNCPIF